MNGSAASAPVDDAVNAFTTRRPNAVVLQIADGSWGIQVPDVPIDAELWTKASTSVAFILPAAYPIQRPDCFWADLDLRLRNGQLPANANIQNPHPAFGPMLWFSYHPQSWDIRCTVETYFHLIQGRLADGR